MVNELQRLEQASNRVLYRTSTVFPFTFFPDVLEVTDSAVKIIYGIFIFSKEVSHIPVTEIHNVRVITSVFFSELIFEIKGYEQNPRKISYLPKQAGVVAEEIISGLIHCALNKIDTIQYPKDELLAYIKSIGKPVTATV